MTNNLRERRIVMRPSDLGIDATDAKRELLSARTIDDLVVCSGGLYVPPPKFRTRAAAVSATKADGKAL
jgi:malonate decarboxylase alpha subunit